MIHKKMTCFAVLVAFLLSQGSAEILTWRANAGEQYEVKVTTKESVTGLNSITEKPESVSDTFRSQEEAAKNRSTIPYLQDIPAFPRNTIEPGAQWKNKAFVTWDLKNFGIETPVTVSVVVSYTLLEITTNDDRTYYHIQAKWSPLWIPDARTSKRTGIGRISGFSTMDLYWDNKAGSPKKTSLNEELQYRFTENSALLLTIKTTEDFQTVTDIVREKMIQDLNKQIAFQKVSNVEVKQTDEGIVLSIENIQFDAESSVLSDAEKKKLSGIGKILSGLGDRKLSIVGHAANIAGSDEAELLKLSADRAKSVAEYLVQSGFRNEDSVVSHGMGGAVPLGDNATAEGRSKNRRVEIVIKDKEAQQ